MLDLKANTQTIVTIGPFVDATDGLTPETGITLGSADEAELLKHGSTSVVDISGATWAAVTNADGYYSLTLTTSHTDTEGQLTVIVQDDSVCLPVRNTFRVLSEAAYDSLYTAKDTGFMDVNIKAISEDTTAADNLEAACDNYSATRGLAGTALPAAAADAAGGLPISDAGGLDMDLIASVYTNTLTSAIEAAVWDAAQVSYAGSGTFGEIATEIASILEDTGTTIPGTISTIDGIVDAILLDTAEIGAAGAGLTAVPWNASWDAEVQSECTDALNAYDPPTNTEMVAAFTEIKGATWATTDTLEAIRDRGDSAWTTGAGGTPPQLLQNTTIATLASQTSFTLTAGSADNDAYNGAVVVVTDSATSTQKAVGSVSDYVGSTKTITLSSDPGIFTMAAGDTIDIIANASTAPSAAAVRAEIDSNSTQLAAIVADTNELQTNQGNWLTATGFSTHSAANVRTEMDSNSTQLAAIVADTNELQSDDVPGLIAALNDAPAVSAATIADAVWDEAQSAHTTTGSFGVIASEIASILVDTDSLVTTVGNSGDGLTSLASAADLATHDSNLTVTIANMLSAAQADLDTITDTGVTCTALTSAAITDVWSTDTLTEAYAADGAAGTPAQILYMIQQATTEASVTGTTLTVKKLDGSTTAATFTLDDATTPTSRTRAT